MRVPNWLFLACSSLRWTGLKSPDNPALDRSTDGFDDFAHLEFIPVTRVPPFLHFPLLVCRLPDAGTSRISIRPPVLSWSRIIPFRATCMFSFRELKFVKFVGSL